MLVPNCCVVLLAARLVRRSSEAPSSTCWCVLVWMCVLGVSQVESRMKGRGARRDEFVPTKMRFVCVPLSSQLCEHRNNS